jgi:beta-galactosidase
MNQPYLDRVEKYFRALALEVKPHLVPNGGPVALIQVENEYANVAKRYGAAGQEYLRWIIELATRVGFAAVPTTTCEGGASGAIETGNGDTFPAEKVARFRAAHPHAPLLWSENYPGWYEIWGGRPHTPRDPREMAFDTLDFVSNGGSGFNYYMWHGGTNFGRTAMYLQATTYDFHAPLDEYGRPTLMGQYLGVMHRALAAHAALIVAGKRTQTTDSSGRIRTVWASESQTLVLFADPAAKTARLTSGERTLFDTHAELQKQTAAFHAPAWLPFGRPATIEWAAEPFPSKRVDPALESADPIEQLSLTHDSSDYLWYTTDITVAQPSNTLLIPYGADMFYVFLDGKLAATSALPLNENRGPILPIDPAHPPIIANHHELEVGGFRHEFTLTASPGRHRLEILSVAVGMIKGDWQIANSMEQERKGIWLGVQLNGQRLTGWRMHPGLAGEGSPVAYAPLGTLTQRLNWFRVSMPVESAGLTENADFRLDAQGLGKGFAVLNGHAVGRYWLIERQGQTGEPTQRFYHIPRSWLRPANELILFEETEAVPTRISLERRHYPSA